MKKIHLTKSFVTGILIILAGVTVMSFLLGEIYSQNAVKEQYANSMNKLDVAASRLSDYQEEADENAAIYDQFNTGSASLFSYYMDQNPKEKDLSWLVSQCKVDEYYLLDQEGILVDHSGDAWQKSADTLKAMKNNSDPVMIGDNRYFCSSLENGGTLIIGRKYQEEASSLSELTTPAYALSSIVVGETGYVADIDIAKDTILYSKNENEIGKSASEYGLDPAAYADGFSGRIKLNGKDCYVVTKQAGEDLLVAIVPWSEITADYQSIEWVNFFVVGLTMFFLLIYAEMIRRELAKKKPQPEDYKQLGKHLYLNKNILSRMKNIVILGIVAVFLLTYYVHTLSPLSHQGVKNELKVTAVAELLDQNEDHITQLKEKYTKEYTQRAKNIAYMINRDPALTSNEAMKTLAEKGNLQAVYLFDGSGHVTASSMTHLNYTLPSDSSNSSYAFWKVVNGYTDSYAEIGTESDGVYEQYIGVSRLDDLGMVEIRLSSDVLTERLQATQLSYLLSHIAVVNQGFLFAVNTETKNFDYIPETKLIDHSALDAGLKQSALVDGYEGFQTLSGEKYLMDGVLRGDDYIYCAVPLDAIYSQRVNSTLWATLISGIMILIITLTLVLSRKTIQPDETEMEKEEKTEGSAFFQHVAPNGRKRLVQSATSRYEAHISWDDQTSEQKLYAIVGWTILALSMLIVIDVAFFHQGNPHSVLSYVLNQKWEKGINVFSLTFVVLTMMEIIIVIWVIRKTLLVVMKKFGARSETVGHLLDSFMKYIAVIGGIFYCLNALGMDSMSLLASASILGLMLSFGAQSLVGDILAGIFIVFEGEFRVGDIVTIGDWRGTVVEIGIRTTKVLSGGHDVKIFNNSEIKQVINMTKQYSTAVLDIGIDYNESLERVEAVLKKELPHIREHVPAIMEGPYYKGVTSLGDSSVNIRILAECHEKDRIQVVRDMNREIKLCFDRNHISIPFPQIVVNQPAEIKEATSEDKKTANQFLHEQKEASKDLSETHDD